MAENARNWYQDDVNYDDATQQQQKAIEDEVLEQQNYLIGNLTGLEPLKEDFKDNKEFSNRILEMEGDYHQMRRVRADGNCFYRAFGFAVFEQVLANEDLFQTFRDAATRTKDTLINDLGYLQFTVEDFYDTFTDELDLFKPRGPSTVRDLEKVFNDQGISDYLVVFLRLIAAAELQKEQEFFVNFIDEGRSVKEFTSQEVEPMGKESDHLQIMALTQATSINVRLFCMERGQHTTINFPSESQPHIHLLYRPGHYEIIYPKTQS